MNNLLFKNNGSISAEHGIGMIKRKSLEKFKSKNEIELMKKIKISLDSKNILNPGEVLNLN